MNGDVVQHELDRDACYRALETRDARFDGRFYTCVTTTGIYCRPICPAKIPKREHCIFVPSAAAAHQLGYRSCLRCRPEIAPGHAGLRGSANTVSRALSLIAEGAFDEAGIEPLAERVGVGARHLRRLFEEHVGASPVEVAQAHRVLFAKRLLTDTSLSMTGVALASGFGSVRRFNDVFRQTYQRPPTDLRRVARVTPAQGLVLKLAYRPPYDWPTMLGFFAARAIPGVERVDAESYERNFVLGAARGHLRVSALPGQNALRATIVTNDVRALGGIVTRLRRVFDLDADSSAIDAHLAKDTRLKPYVKKRPGLRVPGAWDAFELSVRAVLGQQVSVAAATTFAARLVKRWGEPLDASDADESPRVLFPTPAVIATADLTQIGLTRARTQTLNALAAAVAVDERLLEASHTLDETVRKLEALPGIGPWTAQYIAMRALREPDAFPASDLGLLRAMEANGQRPTPKALLQHAEAWRPWRAYATLRLWLQ